ncbi:MAG: hypothetical protein MUF50_02790 [Planctomycetes bacterium]|jgi:hypothetical protein|nr:hypothetical protein [Planctomycetota bacterium]
MKRKKSALVVGQKNVRQTKYENNYRNKNFNSKNRIKKIVFIFSILTILILFIGYFFFGDNINNQSTKSASRVNDQNSYHENFVGVFDNNIRLSFYSDKYQIADFLNHRETIGRDVINFFKDSVTKNVIKSFPNSFPDKTFSYFYGQDVDLKVSILDLERVMIPVVSLDTDFIDQVKKITLFLFKSLNSYQLPSPRFVFKIINKETSFVPEIIPNYIDTPILKIYVYQVCENRVVYDIEAVIDDMKLVFNGKTGFAESGGETYRETTGNFDETGNFHYKINNKKAIFCSMKDGHYDNILFEVGHVFLETRFLEILNLATTKTVKKNFPDFQKKGVPAEYLDKICDNCLLLEEGINHAGMQMVMEDMKKNGVYPKGKTFLPIEKLHDTGVYIYLKPIYKYCLRNKINPFAVYQNNEELKKLIKELNLDIEI